MGILIIVLLAFFLVVNQKSLKNIRNRKELPSIERNLFTLQIGDIVQYLGDDWAVEKKLTYEDDGYIWLEYMLQDGNRIRWLAVEEDDLVKVTWLEPTKALEISGIPPRQLTWDGESYRCVDSGIATVNFEGTIECH